MGIKCVIRRRTPDTGATTFFKSKKSWVHDIQDAYVFNTKTEARKCEGMSDACDVVPVYVSMESFVVEKRIAVTRWTTLPQVYVIRKRTGYGEDDIIAIFDEEVKAINALESLLAEQETKYVKFQRIKGSENGGIVRFYADKWATDLVIERRKLNSLPAIIDL